MMVGNVSVDNVSMKCFAGTVRNECRKFFTDPENMRRFEAWKAARDAEIARRENRNE